MANIGDIITTPESGWRRISASNRKLGIGYIGNFIKESNSTFTDNINLRINDNCIYRLLTASKVSCRFSGTKVRLLFGKNINYSDNVIIRLDGIETSIDTKDTSITSPKGKYLMYENLLLEDRIHQLDIYAKSKNDQPDNTIIWSFDSIEIDENTTLHLCNGCDVTGLNTALVKEYNTISKDSTNIEFVNKSYSNSYINYSYNEDSRVNLYFYGSILFMTENCYRDRGYERILEIDGEIVQTNLTGYDNEYHTHDIIALSYISDDNKRKIHKFSYYGNPDTNQVFAQGHIITDGYLCTKDGEYIDVTGFPVADYCQLINGKNLLHKSITGKLLKINDQIKTFDYTNKVLVDATLNDLNFHPLDMKNIILVNNVSNLIKESLNDGNMVSILSSTRTTVQVSGSISDNGVIIFGNDFYTISADVINKIYSTYNVPEGTSIKFIVSKDSGNTWYTYNTDWEILSGINNDTILNSFETINQRGISITDIEITNFNTFGSKKISFAMSLYSISTDKNVSLSNINWKYREKPRISELDSSECKKEIFDNTLLIKPQNTYDKLFVNISTLGQG